MNNPIKITRYRKELDQFRRGELVVPRKVQIDPVSFCNHDCPFCIYRYDRDADMNALFDLKDILPLAKITEILQDCADLGIKAVELTGGGEPTLHPEFPSILETVLYLGLDLAMVTNGAWQDKHFDQSIKYLSRAEWVRFSLDAATPDTHRIVHASRKGDFEKACKAIEILSASECTVGISFIVQRGNVHEVSEIVPLAEKLGVDYVRIGGVVFEGERIDDIELSITEHIKTAEIVRDIVDTSDINVQDDFSSRSCKTYPQYNAGDTCYYSYLSTTIGADGRLYPCCIWKYRPDGVIADLNEVRLSDVWRSGVVDEYYKKFDISEKCTRCFLKPKNDFVALMLSDTIPHLNYV